MLIKSCFNRYIVECKYEIRYSQGGALLVLIDT